MQQKWGSVPSIKLIPLCPADAPEMFGILSAPEIYIDMEDAPPCSVDALRERYQFLAKQESPDKTETWLNWIIRVEESKDALGFVQATVKKSSNVALIAFVLNPQFWGHGLATKAVSVMLKTLNQDFGVNVFRATVNDSNLRSVKLLRRFGFRDVGNSPIEGGKIELAFELTIHTHRSQFGWDGDSGIGDRLITQIIIGAKTSTAAPLDLYTDTELREIRGSVGKLATVTDKDGNPRCNIIITDVFETTFGNPDPRLVRGEGYGTDASEFQRSHERAWGDLVVQGRLTLDASTILMVELFERA